MITIPDISKITGYSTATVSRALSGKGYCSKDAKEKILKCAKEHHYVFNPQAKSLRENKTNRIFFCIPDLLNPFYFRVIQGVTDVLRPAGYQLLLVPTGRNIENEIKTIQLAEGRMADGIIICSLNFCDRNIDAIRNSQVPTVLGNQYLGQKEGDNFDYVYVDHVLGMKKATDCLINQGCKNILLVTGDLKEQTSYERVSGYRKALENHARIFNSEYIIDGNYEKDKAYQAMKDFMKLKKPFDGIIAGNDLSAVGIYQALGEKGVTIPIDVKLVSFDNTDFASICNPDITSIDMCQYQLGFQMATRLLDRIAGETKIRNIILEPELVRRKSA